MPAPAISAAAVNSAALRTYQLLYQKAKSKTRTDCHCELCGFKSPARRCVPPTALVEAIIVRNCPTRRVASVNGSIQNCRPVIAGKLQQGSLRQWYGCVPRVRPRDRTVCRRRENVLSGWAQRPPTQCPSTPLGLGFWPFFGANCASRVLKIRPRCHPVADGLPTRKPSETSSSPLDSRLRAVRRRRIALAKARVRRS